MSQLVRARERFNDAAARTLESRAGRMVRPTDRREMLGHGPATILAPRRSVLASAAAMWLVASLIVPAPVLASTSLSVDWETQAALTAVNDARIATGLPGLRANLNLIQAASAHSSYIAQNGLVITHSEVAGKPGFTGATPTDRAVAAGYSNGVGEVITSGHDGRASVELLLATVYHRHILLSPDVAELGYGGVGHSVTDLGYSWAGTPTDVARYPVPGATAVPLSWVGNETPSPVVGLQGPFGYPITLEWGYAAGVVTLDGVQLRGPAGDVGIKTENWGGRALSAVPLAPLAPSTTYRVTFSFHRSGAALTESWSFSTEAARVGAPTGLWIESGDFGRIVHWSPPVGAAPAAYRITKCASMCFNPNTFTVNADQLYWTDPAPGVPGYLIISALRGGEESMTSIGGDPRPASAPYASSKWVAQSPYPTLAAGEISELWFAFRNSGTTTWTRGAWGSQANLGLNGDNKAPYRLGMNVDWLWDDRVATTDQTSVAPGEVGMFRFKLRAPQSPGVYRFSVRAVVDGLAWLQDEGVFLTVTVR